MWHTKTCKNRLTKYVIWCYLFCVLLNSSCGEGKRGECMVRVCTTQSRLLDSETAGLSPMAQG
jgi:hypothetical protein